MNARMLLALLATMLSCPPGWAQEATERYIPIGASPGLSQRSTYIGEVAVYDAAANVLRMRGPAGERAIRITEATRIWLDRSRVRKNNLRGSANDLVAGRRVEVAYVDPDDRTVADWVKVEVGE